MASSPESSEIFPDSVAQAVFRYYEKEQLANPHYFETLSAELWEALTDEEKDFRRFALSSFYPSDPAGNARAARAQLVIEYITRQVDMTKELDAALEEPRIVPVPGQILPIFSAGEYDVGEAQPPAT